MLALLSTTLGVVGELKFRGLNQLFSVGIGTLANQARSVNALLYIETLNAVLTLISTHFKKGVEHDPEHVSFSGNYASLAQLVERDTSTMR